MKIGDVAARTGVAARLIRYYEQQGLLTVERSGNGYRDYTEEHVARVATVAQLVQSGMPTKLAKVVLDLEEAAARHEDTCPAEVVEQLTEELVGLESRIACLTKSRDTICNVLDRTKHAVRTAGQQPAGEGA